VSASSGEAGIDSANTFDSSALKRSGCAGASGGVSGDSVAAGCATAMPAAARAPAAARPGTATPIPSAAAAARGSAAASSGAAVAPPAIEASDIAIAALERLPFRRRISTRTQARASRITPATATTVPMMTWVKPRSRTM